jgi:hypothetical protein
MGGAREHLRPRQWKLAVGCAKLKRMSQLAPVQSAHRDRYHLPVNPPGLLLVGSADRFACIGPA